MRAVSILVCVLAATPAAADGKRLWAGGEIGVMTLGQLTPHEMDLGPKDEPTVFALGINARYGISQLLSVGLATRLAFGVDSLVQNESGHQLDVRARLAVGKAVRPTIKAYGFVSPGYTVIYDGNLEPSGFLVGFGAGAAYALGPGIALTGELGYQLAWLTYDGIFKEEKMDQRYASLTVGFVVPIR